MYDVLYITIDTGSDGEDQMEESDGLGLKQHSMFLLTSSYHRMLNSKIHFIVLGIDV